MEHHRGALAYDWRTRFGLPLTAIFDGSLSWHSAWLYTEQLMLDPTSRVFQSVNGLRFYSPVELAVSRGVEYMVRFQGAKKFEWMWPFETAATTKLVARDDADRVANMHRLNAL